MASTPTFVFTSPSDRQPVIPSTSTNLPANAPEHSGTELAPPPNYLPPWSSVNTQPGQKDLATNAPSSPPLKSRTPIPRPGVSMDQSTLLGVINEKAPVGVGNLWFGGQPQNTLASENEGPESSRILRGRALRVNTLHQRAYHNQDASPPDYAPDGTLPFSDSSTVALDQDVLLPLASPPLVLSPSKTRFLRKYTSSSWITSSYLYRKILSIPDSPQVWLALYFVLNLTLTLYNKSVLIHFPFPYTLTALHALCGTIGTCVLLRLESSANGPHGSHKMLTSPSVPPPMPNLNGKELIVLFMFSILYTLNIVVSNASLRLVTVPFHQVVRASAPFFTIMFAAMLLGRRSSKRKLLALVPVVAGVGFATYGDYYFTAFGFFLTLLGTLFAALKTTLTNIILKKPSLPQESNQPNSDEIIVTSHQSYSAFPPNFFSSLAALLTNALFAPSPTSSPTYPLKPLSAAPPTISHALPSPSIFTLPKLALSPLHLLYLLSPLAFIQTTLMAHFTGELDRVRWHFSSAAINSTLGAAGANGRMWLLLNGILAFFLNVVSFNANRRVGPLGMSVAANVKQVLTILCAVVVFDLTITMANGVGIALTLLGGALYAAVELREREEKKSRVG